MNTETNAKYIIVLTPNRNGDIGKVWAGPETGWSADVRAGQDFTSEMQAKLYLVNRVHRMGWTQAEVISADRFTLVTGNPTDTDWCRFVRNAEADGYTVRRNEDFYALVDEDGCCVLELPVSVPVAFAVLSLSALGSAYRRGFDHGQAETRTDIRRALGL